MSLVILGVFLTVLGMFNSFHDKYFILYAFIFFTVGIFLLGVGSTIAIRELF